MNDLLNDITKPRIIKELFNTMLKIVSKIYDRIIPVNIKQRKNKFFCEDDWPKNNHSSNADRISRKVSKWWL